MNTRAVSPVIAVVLLMLITISAVVFFDAWQQSLTGPVEEKGQELSSGLSKQIRGDIEILNVDNSSGVYRVTVYNSGKIALNNLTLYVNDLQDSGTLDYLPLESLDKINSSIIVSAGTYRIKVATAEGIEALWRGEV